MRGDATIGLCRAAPCVAICRRAVVKRGVAYGGGVLAPCASGIGITPVDLRSAAIPIYVIAVAARVVAGVKAATTNASCLSGECDSCGEKCRCCDKHFHLLSPWSGIRSGRAIRLV